MIVSGRLEDPRKRSLHRQHRLHRQSPARAGALFTQGERSGSAVALAPPVSALALEAAPVLAPALALALEAVRP